MKKKKYLLGVDIGGTKCSVLFGCAEDDRIEILDKDSFPTKDRDKTLNQIFDSLSCLIEKHLEYRSCIHAIGVSCGGPLDNQRGVILSPPNLPGWDDVEIVRMLETRFNLPAAIENDANACALAEWKSGAGRGTHNMIFLTFGTGLGAGIILNGTLYTGTNGNAGEIGHIRLEPFGPVGFGKAGSFEGFCSGGGIAQLARSMVLEEIQKGNKPSFCNSIDKLPSLSARVLADAANAGDPLAKRIFQISGYYLGKGLSILIDVLNPEMIVIGSIYQRVEHLLRDYAQEVIMQESLCLARQVCLIKSAYLGDQIGDYAALSVAANYK